MYNISKNWDIIVKRIVIIYVHTMNGCEISVSKHKIYL